MYSIPSKNLPLHHTTQNNVSPPPPAKRRKKSPHNDRTTDPGATASHKPQPDARKATAASNPPVAPERPVPAPHWLSIYSWNINGIAPFLQPSMLAYMKPGAGTHALHKSNSNAPITTSLRNFLRRHDWPQILHLQEVKINPSDEATQRSVQRAVNVCRSGPDNGPSYTVKFCLPKDKFNATGFGRKVYGVATVIRDDYLENEVSAVREVDWDVEGRVLVVETKSRLALFNIYAVNGTSNAYRDPATGNPIGTRHDRKLIFHRCLLDECMRLERNGWRLVLAGDFNVAPAAIDGFPNLRTKPEQHVRNRHDFNKKFLCPQQLEAIVNGAPEAKEGSAQDTKDEAAAQEAPPPPPPPPAAADADDENAGLGAVDSFRHLHPKRKRYTYMPRNRDWMESGDRVDLILLSKTLVQPDQEMLKEADILMLEAERGPSDHVPLFVWLDPDSEKGIFEEW